MEEQASDKSSTSYQDNIYQEIQQEQTFQAQVAYASGCPEETLPAELVELTTIPSMKERYDIIMQHNRDLARMFESVSVELQRMQHKNVQLQQKLDQTEHELAAAKREMTVLKEEVEDATRELAFKKRRVSDLDEDASDYQDRIRAQNIRARMIGEKLQELRKNLGHMAQEKVQEILDMVPIYD